MKRALLVFLVVLGTGCGEHYTVCSEICDNAENCGSPFESGTVSCVGDCQDQLSACSDSELEAIEACQHKCDFLFPCLAAVLPCQGMERTEDASP